MNRRFKTPSRTSPKNTKRGCLCADGKRYSRKCCDGSLQAQGIGSIRGTAVPSFVNEKSINFDGIDDYVLADSSVFDLFGTPSQYFGDITYSTWFKRSASGIRGLVHCGNQNFAYGMLFGLLFVNDELRIGIANGSRATVSVPYDNDWHHIFYVQKNDGSNGCFTLKLYLDGTELYNNQVCNISSNGLATIGIELTLGRSSTHYEFAGDIDECALWTSDQTEIKDSVYNNGVPSDLSSYNPDLWYRMGDNDTFPTIIDNGSGSNNGTMTNMASDDIVEDVPE